MADMEAVERRIADLNRKVDEANNANASAKTTGRVVTVVVVIAAVIGVWMLLSPLYSAWNNQAPYQEAIQREFTDNVVPVLSAEASAAAKEVGPEVIKEVKLQVEKRYEDVLKVAQAETNTLIENMKSYTEKELSDTVVNIEIGIQTKLSETLPEINDEDARELILGNASTALENAVKRIIDDKLHQHITMLAEIDSKLMQFPVSDDLKEMPDDRLSDELNKVLSEFSLVAIRRTLAPEHKSFLREIAADENTTN